MKRPPLDFGPVHNDPRCGLSATRRNVAQRRIVGGSEAGFGTFPWQAYIRVGKLISLSRLSLCFFCTGGLVCLIMLERIKVLIAPHRSNTKHQNLAFRQPYKHAHLARF